MGWAEAETMYRPPSPEEQLANLLRQMAEVEAAFAHHPEPFLERTKEDIMRSIGQVKHELKDAIADGKSSLENWWQAFATDPREGYTCAAVWDPENPGNFDYIQWIEYSDERRSDCALWNDANGVTDWSEYDRYYKNGWQCAAVWDNEHWGDYGYMQWIEYKDKDTEGCCLWVDQEMNVDWTDYDAYYSNFVVVGNL